MSLETLESDLKSNIAEVQRLSALSSTDEVTGHLKTVMWPFLEALVEELVELDASLKSVLYKEEDILQPETGAVFAAVVAGAVTVAGALKARITREAEPQLYKVIDELEKNSKEAEEILEEIVLEEIDDDDDDDEYEDDDDDDEEEDEDDETEDDESDAAEGTPTP